MSADQHSEGPDLDAMSSSPEVEESESAESPGSVTRRELLRVGWTVPLVTVLSLPDTASAGGDHHWSPGTEKKVKEKLDDEFGHHDWENVFEDFDRDDWEDLEDHWKDDELDEWWEDTRSDWYDWWNKWKNWWG